MAQVKDNITTQPYSESQNMTNNEISRFIPDFQLCPGFHMSSLLFAGLCYHPSSTTLKVSNELFSMEQLIPSFNSGPSGNNFFQVRTQDGCIFINPDSYDLSYSVNSIKLPNPSTDNRDPNNHLGLYYYYDRNPSIMHNLIRVIYFSSLFSSITQSLDNQFDKIICLDYKPDPISVINSHFNTQIGTPQEQMKYFLTKCFPTIFFTQNGVKLHQLPLHIEFKSKGENLPHLVLYLALGSINQEIQLILFLNGLIFLITHDKSIKLKSIDSISDFTYYILIYIRNDEINPSIEYKLANQYSSKRSALSLFNENIFINPYVQPLFQIINTRVYKWKQVVFTFEDYLNECIQFPSAFIKGTKSNFDFYSKYLSLVFSFNVSTESEFKLQQFTKEQVSEGHYLFMNYQKFLRFTRYIIMIIQYFLKDNFSQIEQILPYLFGVLPVANPYIIATSLKLLDFICSKNEAVQKRYTVLYHATIADNKVMRRRNLAEEGQKETTYSTVFTVPHILKILKSAFKGLKEKLNDNQLSFLPQIRLSQTMDEIEITYSAKEYIFKTLSSINDIGFV